MRDPIVEDARGLTGSEYAARLRATAELMDGMGDLPLTTNVVLSEVRRELSRGGSRGSAGRSSARG
jgi:hypothetical protein